MKILLYGSTKLTEVVADRLAYAHQLVGYVPSRKPPTVPGTVRATRCLAEGEALPAHDLALSIQYDRLLLPNGRTYNLHTGLLPAYGGCDVLYHTLRLGAREQGLTFHQISEGLDNGPVISKVTYPVLPGDTILDLYRRLLIVAPDFTVGALKLLEHLGARACECASYTPTLHKRGDILEYDRMAYEATRDQLRKVFA